MRVALARALFLEPDLLLLDEPTNHLDLEATLWLEGWLQRFPGAAIVVSHDRGLLDRCVDIIAHLDRSKITTYQGNFENFVRQKTERAAQAAAEATKIAAQRAHMQAFVDRFRYKASKARQAQSRLKALQKLPPLDMVIEDTPTRFAFPAPEQLSPPIVAIERADVGYGGPPILRNLTLRLDPDDRIALLGANGNGKSTLAKLLAGRLAPGRGEIRRASRLKVGFFAQHQAEELDPAGTPLTHMRAALPKATDTQVRSQLARFGLAGEKAETLVSACSGGEKARLLLALCTRDAPNLLILDEPTNHLDIDAREALVKALADFEGAVLLITHDPHLVELVADRLWLVADGTVTPFEGDLSEYRTLLAERARATARDGNAAPGGARAAERRERAESREKLAPLRQRLKEVEKQLERLGLEAKLIEKRLADPETYAKRKAEDIAWATTRRAAIARETAALEEEWLALSESLDAA
jgi:ATP-binding cassette subfamily F protein 3